MNKVFIFLVGCFFTSSIMAQSKARPGVKMGLTQPFKIRPMILELGYIWVSTPIFGFHIFMPCSPKSCTRTKGEKTLFLASMI